MNEVQGGWFTYYFELLWNTNKLWITLSRESILGAKINREVGGGLLT